MDHVTHQTVRLGKGRHSSPEHGACVMELASMLAGEAFSDHPQSVSRPIAAFLRNYNDLLDERRRQDLYAYAAKAVGTIDSHDVEQARMERLLSWGDEMWDRRSRYSLLRRIARRCAREGRRKDPEGAARYAIHSIGRISTETHVMALKLLDELVGIGASGRAPAPSRPTAPETTGRHGELGGVA